MPKRIFRKLLGFQLIAIMLASSFISPGYRHAHEGGSDLSHGHANETYAASHQTPGNESEDHHSSQDFPLFAGCTDVKTHLHLLFYGFSVTLPDTNHSPEKSGGNSQKNQIVSIRTIEDILHVTQSNTDTNNWLVLIAQDFFPHAVVVVTGISHSLQSATSAFLCDQARHERSGVQLI